MYVGTLSYIAGSTGRNFALQAEHTFGKYGYTVASGFLATIVIGWYAFETGLTGTTVHTSFGWNQTLIIIIAAILYTGITFIGINALSILGMIAAPLYVILGLVAVALIAVGHGIGAVFSYQGLDTPEALTLGSAVTFVVATFADSGTMTADFTRWARDGRSAFYAAFTAFPVANMVAQIFGVVIVAAGAAATPAQSGGDFLPVLTSHGSLLAALALVFVFINLDEDGVQGKAWAVPCSASAEPRSASGLRTCGRQPPSGLHVIAKINHFIVSRRPLLFALEHCKSCYREYQWSLTLREPGENYANPEHREAAEFSE